MAHLLIVDNDERIVELTVWFLRRMGHEVDSAFSYAAAREQLALRRPELMLADLDLGLESGLEELPKLAAEGCLPPTMVISGFLDSALERQLLAIPGVLATLAKPVDLTALGDHIAACLGRVVEPGGEVAGGVGSAAPLEPEPQPAPAVHEIDLISQAAPTPLEQVSTPLEQASSLTEDEIDDGWVEIAPLAPDVTPASPGSTTLHGEGAGA